MSVTQKDSSDVRHNEVKAYNGYTLFTAVGTRDVYLVDMKGRPAHTWRMPFEVGANGVLLPSSNLLCAAKATEGPLANFEGAAGRLLEVDWDSNIVWQYEDPYMHHHFCRLPNGNTVLLRWIPTPKDTALKVRGGLPDTEREGIIWSDSLREINPAGEVVWEWLGYEHLDPEVDIICPLCFRSEWTHANSFAVTPNVDILISFMKTNSIAIINKETGNIDWRWGGFLKLAHPHDVSWLDDGSVMVLGCGGHMPGFEAGNSEVLRIDLKTKNIVWEYTEVPIVRFYTALKGSLQRLPNGNTLICEGDTGRIFEVTEGKEIVWEFVNPFYHPLPIYGQKNNMLFCAYRYGPAYEGLEGNVGVPSEFQPVPEEKVKSRVKRGYPPEGKQALKERLANLGY